MAVADEERSSAQLTSREADAEQAKTSLRSNEIAVETERRAKYVLESQEQQLVADLHAKQAAFALAQVNLGYTKISAPADGIVGERQVRPGQLLSPGHVLEIAPASGSQFALLPPDNTTGNFTKVVQRVPVKIALDDANHVENQNCMDLLGGEDSTREGEDRSERYLISAAQRGDSAVESRPIFVANVLIPLLLGVGTKQVSVLACREENGGDDETRTRDLCRDSSKSDDDSK